MNAADVIPTLHASSPQAAAIADLFRFTLILCAVIFIVVAGLVAYASLRYRARPGAPEPSQESGNTKLEIGWTAAALLVVTILFGLTLQTMRAADPPAQGRDPDLVIVGHQWWWEVRYPRSGIVTANEIHLPVGERQLLRLESADVIHDFWVPQLGRKVDMIPGHPNDLWLSVSDPGTYLGTCSEFCGAQHAWMRLRVVAERRPDFDAWQQRQLDVPPLPQAGAAARGSSLFRQRTCVSCHAVAGTAAVASIGPDLTHVASRETLGAGVLANSSANLTRWLADPQAIKPGSHMPNLQLTPDEVQDLAAYLETLR